MEERKRLLKFTLKLDKEKYCEGNEGTEEERWREVGEGKREKRKGNRRNKRGVR